MIQEIEDAIVARLRETFPDLDVDAMPDDVTKYKTKNPKGTILVGFAKTQFSDPFSEEGTVQDLRFRFLAAFLLRDLRSHKGTYARLETAFLALAGFDTQVPNVDPLFPSAAQFIRNFQGTWQYDLEIIATARIYQ